MPLEKVKQKRVTYAKLHKIKRKHLILKINYTRLEKKFKYLNMGILNLDTKKCNSHSS